MKYTALVTKDEDGFYIAEIIGIEGIRTYAKTLPALRKQLDEKLVEFLKTKKTLVAPKEEYKGILNVYVRS